MDLEFLSKWLGIRFLIFIYEENSIKKKSCVCNRFSNADYLVAAKLQYQLRTYNLL
jgi:hypothetical protein